MNGLGAAPALGPGEEAQGLSRKKVASAVRKVVNKVLPGEEPAHPKETPSRGVKSPEHPTRGKKGEKATPTPPPPPPPPPAPPKAKPEAKKEAAKDEISVGLRSLMARGRGKEHKPRGRQSPGKGEKPSTQSPTPLGKPGSPAKSVCLEKQGSPIPPGEPVASDSPGPEAKLPGVPQAESPVPDGQKEVLVCDTKLPSASHPACSGLLVESCMAVWWP